MFDGNSLLDVKIERTIYILGVIPNLGRLLLAAVFVGSYLLQPLQLPIMRVWARVVESGKPVFTLLFGGVAAIAKGVEEIVKNVF